MPDSTPYASILICTYNRADLLRRVLEELAPQLGELDVPAEVLVVDNHSTDDTAAAVAELERNPALGLRYLFEPEQGKTKALNRGLRAVRGEIVVFTDDDVQFNPGWLAELLSSF